nr:CP52k-like protein 10 [Membranobalanus longirostrum]
MLGPMLMMVLSGAASAQTSLTGASLQPALTTAGLSSFSSTTVALGGLASFLQQKEISLTTFNSRVTQYETKIRSSAGSVLNRIGGQVGDLRALLVLHYYVSEPIVVNNIPLLARVAAFAEKQNAATLVYTVENVKNFLLSFDGELAETFPPLGLLTELTNIGLPTLKQQENSLNGLLSYLDSARIDRQMFVDSISSNGDNIKTLFEDNKMLYDEDGDLVQLAAAVYYYGDTSTYFPTFTDAFSEAVPSSDENSPAITKNFLDSFVTRLNTPLPELPDLIFG